MKHLFLIFTCLIAVTGYGQFDKGMTVRATANFNVTLNGLATNDAGAGLGVDASFFSTRRLQAIIETSADRFIGDKLLITDSIYDGKQAKKATVYSIKAGPPILYY